MDKVIDGVDVSGCEHYRAKIETKMPYGEYEIQKDKCHYSGIEVIQNCKGIKDCIYKQLKRLQAENEQIKKDYAKLHIDFAKCNEENERLKARLRPLEDSYFNGLSSIQIAELAKKSIRITAENRKLEQALQEIRDIAERQLLVTNVRTYQMVYYADFYQYRNEILTKINEVIGAE